MHFLSMLRVSVDTYNIDKYVISKRNNQKKKFQL